MGHIEDVDVAGNCGDLDGPRCESSSRRHCPAHSKNPPPGPMQPGCGQRAVQAVQRPPSTKKNKKGKKTKKKATARRRLVRQS